MLPRLFELGPITVYSYGVLLASSYLLALYYAVRRARRFGLDGNRVLDLGIYIIISALIGAKLLLLVVDFDYFWRQPAELWTLARSGGVFYGGLVVAFAVAFWYVRRHRLPVWPVADAIAPGIALGHVVGRFGCLLAGCCYGKPTMMPWGITFTDPVRGQQRRHAAARGAPPDAALRCRGRVPRPALPARDRAVLAAAGGVDVLGLHPALRGLALRDRVLPRRSSRSQPGLLDVPVDLDGAGARCRW